MKVKNLSLLVSATILALSFAPALPSMAQSSDPGQAAPTRVRKANKLNLTEQQKTEMKRIRETGKVNMERYLGSIGKLDQFKAGIAAGQKPREVMQSLNLTDAQKQELRNIMEQSRREAENVLTEEQKQQLRQSREGRQSRRVMRQPR
jgi:Spy/CpxP family protein refolding chaperone